VELRRFDDSEQAATAAADRAANVMREAVDARGRARIIAATGRSQIAFLEALTRIADVPWHRVQMFQLDEYIGLPIEHPASFSRFLSDRLIAPTEIAEHHLLDGKADPEYVCAEAGRAITAAPIDVAFLGIGENGHLAFNDPPADFETEQPYIVVTLDDACRRQQVGEGWFATVDDVPQQAITMSIRQILKSREILCIVPEERKARAVHDCFTGGVVPQQPASALRTHHNTTVFLDPHSASRLHPDVLARGRL
jgi:glucosamine-6-phosphate deaminase